MKFTYNWLREYVPVEATAQEIAARLSLLGLEVDAVQPLYPELNEVRIARVAKVQPHPNADRLSLCDVEDGSEELRRVVCGAPNVRAGMFTALVTPGTVLPGGLKIRTSKIRGESSNGMLCSEQELGLTPEGTPSSGIMEIDPDEFPGLYPGAALAGALNLEDTVIEVDLTPNRPDCTGVIGIAREVAGFTGLPLTRPVSRAPELSPSGIPFSLEVNTAQCHRYVARLIRNVRIAPSPQWLQRRLVAVGLRPINNVVDITNLVMLEYAQPLHAFDFTGIAQGKIVVRSAEAGEKITTLDGVERNLTTQMMVIADGEKPLAVAGVMGGAGSEVKPETVDILLESACFEAKSVRRTAADLKLNTDSSYRFERGVDPLGAPLALERAVRLILELAGGEVLPGGVDYREGVVTPPELDLRLSRVNQILGSDLDIDTVERVLAGIEIRGRRLDDELLRINPPSFRVDLEREIDLIEEVARLVGYDAIPTSMPKVEMALPDLDPAASRKKKVCSLLGTLGCFEAINYSFVSPAHPGALGLVPEERRSAPLALVNPLSEEQSVLRTTLLPGLLENVRHNINHQTPDLRIFELGKVFYPQDDGLPHEQERLAVVMGGRRYPDAPLIWEGEAPVDIFDVKGLLEELLASLGLERRVEITSAGDGLPYAEAGCRMELKRGKSGEIVGECGKFKQSVLKAFGIKQELFYLDVDMSALVGMESATATFQPLPRFPAVKWDLAVLVPEEVAVGEMLDAIAGSGGKILELVELFDIYRGKKIESGRKSVAFTIHYRDAQQTLNDKKVGAVHNKIIQMLERRFHAQLREG